MSNRKRILLALAVVATMFTVVVIGELFRNEPIKRTTPIAELDSPTTTTTIAPSTTSSTTTTTTTVAPPTTTRPRPATTTAPEPEVQGEAVVANNASVSLDDPDMDEWRAIARCEMPGPGGVPSEPWGVHWSFKGTWSGSLGVYNQTWLGAGGGKYGPTAGHATWQQQIEIARVIRDRYGYRAWGCGRKLGLG